MNFKKAIVAGDHYAADLAIKVAGILREKGLEVENVGSESSEAKLSLQDMIPRVTTRLSDDIMGVLICGTGVGVEVGANRFKGVRASLCTSQRTAKDARKFDKANVLCLSSWQTEDPEKIIDTWLNTDYDGNESRLEMFEEFDKWAK
jgi:ribose 5-phosphate isomerase B